MDPVTAQMIIRQARPDEAALVSAVLGAAAAKLSRNGQELWGPREVSVAAVQDQVRAGRYHVALDGPDAVGVFRLDLEDRLFWPEVADGSSLFLHKLAVVPHRQGQGVADALLRHACELARQQGRRFLRLDCMGGRPGLRAVYERFGFTHHSDRKLGAWVFHRFEFDLNLPGSDGVATLTHGQG